MEQTQYNDPLSPFYLIPKYCITLSFYVLTYGRPITQINWIKGPHSVHQITDYHDDDVDIN